MADNARDNFVAVLCNDLFLFKDPVRLIDSRKC